MKKISFIVAMLSLVGAVHVNAIDPVMSPVTQPADVKPVQNESMMQNKQDHSILQNDRSKLLDGTQHTDHVVPQDSHFLDTK